MRGFNVDGTKPVGADKSTTSWQCQDTAKALLPYHLAVSGEAVASVSNDERIEAVAVTIMSRIASYCRYRYFLESEEVREKHWRVWNGVVKKSGLSQEYQEFKIP